MRNAIVRNHLKKLNSFKLFRVHSGLRNYLANSILGIFSRDTAPAYGRHFVLKRRECKKIFRRRTTGYRGSWKFSVYVVENQRPNLQSNSKTFTRIYTFMDKITCEPDNTSHFHVSLSQEYWGIHSIESDFERSLLPDFSWGIFSILFHLCCGWKRRNKRLFSAATITLNKFQLFPETLTYVQRT